MGWVEMPTRTAHGDPCVVLRLDAPLSGIELADLCQRVDTLIRLGCGAELVCDLTALQTVDLGLVDQLARLRLAARRAGGTVAFRHAGKALTALFALVGLEEVLLRDPEARAASVERERQPEQLEDPGVQEDVEVRHPPV
jgi:ABC-type transporter Mla MlaB component